MRSMKVLARAGRMRAHRVATFLEARGVKLVLLACIVGAISGAVVTAMGNMVQQMHRMLFKLPGDVRLSGMIELRGWGDAAIPIIGGGLMGLTIWLARRYRPGPMVDPIEANALYGGRISFNDTLIVAGQTMISSGFGASVGLEAGYTQMGSGIASRLARWLNLRRNDVRMLVGCGSAGAVAAAFGAPLTGAFYGYELIIGVYSVANVAPVMAAAVCANLVATSLGAPQFPIEVDVMAPITANQYGPFLLLAVLAGLASIVVMRLVTLVEQGFSRIRVGAAFRPVLGGVIVGALGMLSPHVLASGHGAMHVFLSGHFSLGVLTMVFVLKIIASAVSIGSGFRGGLFFASLFMGALLGNMFAAVMGSISPTVALHVSAAAVVGMTTFAVGVVGAPLTMTFLALESTGDLSLTGIVLATAIMASLLVRTMFGYSFSTWRLHLRGETIRSPLDIGWMRDLTVRSMMRPNPPTVSLDMPLKEFRQRFRLGATQRVVAVDVNGDYAGVIFVPDAYADDLPTAAEGREITIRSLAKFADAVLIPPMNVKAAAAIFEKEKADELAVVEGLKNRKVIGILTESHMMRRYSEELEKARTDISGGD